MGKSNKATRKELTDDIKEIKYVLKKLIQSFTALDNYVGMYVEYKGDRIAFTQHLQDKVGKAKNPDEIKKPVVEDNTKNEKQSRYKKLAEAAK
jgi:DICT domain-containing protein